MRLKNYTAPTKVEAMEMVRRELGVDAYIVSEQRQGMEIRITAALDDNSGGQAISEMIDSQNFNRIGLAVREAVEYHNVPLALCEKLVNLALGIETNDALAALAGALDQSISFAPLSAAPDATPVMLVGPPGSGKSSTIAKLAARSRMNGLITGVITTDTVRAGANAQLSAFTDILQIQLQTARDPETLRVITERLKSQCDQIFIDSPGVNPFNQADVNFITRMSQAANVEPVLVMAAGGDPLDSTELAEIFAAAGVRRLIGTRLDLARRLGGLISAAATSGLYWADISISGSIADGLAQTGPMELARILMPDPPPAEDNTQQDTAGQTGQPQYGYGEYNNMTGENNETDFLDDFDSLFDDTEDKPRFGPGFNRTEPELPF